MRFRVEHLGQIESAELDIRPLTLLVGRNNTNKTWAAYALYGLLKQAAWGQDRPVAERTEPDAAARPEDVAIARAIAPWVEKIAAAVFDPAAPGKQVERFSLTVSRRELLPPDVQGFTFHLAANGLARLLALPPERTTGSIATLHVASSEEPAPRLDVAIHVSDGMLRVLDEHHATRLYFNSDVALRAWLEIALSDLVLQSFYRVFALPAERKTLTATYGHLRDTIEQILPTPTVDFVNFLRGRQASYGSLGWLLGEPDNLSLQRLRRVLEGRVGYAQAGPGWQPVYTPQQASFTLPIQAASSLVRAMAGLDLILQHGLGRGDVLLIDEVEMNAHPATQLALVELLCTLVREGVYVIMTSHSPYVVDHLNNLMLASTLPAEVQERFRERFSLGTTDAFLPPDMVSAYLFEHGGHVQDIMDREARRISWTTFAEVSDQLSNLYADLDMAAGSGEVDG